MGPEVPHMWPKATLFLDGVPITLLIFHQENTIFAALTMHFALIIWHFQVAALKKDRFFNKHCFLLSFFSIWAKNPPICPFLRM